MIDADSILNRARPLTHQQALEMQVWFVAEHVVEMPLVEAVTTQFNFSCLTANNG
jgi:hypothetical protein